MKIVTNFNRKPRATGESADKSRTRRGSGTLSRFLWAVCTLLGVAFALPLGSSEDEDLLKALSTFTKGADVMEMPEAQQETYVIGVFDGLMVRSLDRELKWRWVQECVGDWDSRQLAAVTRKYLEEHPEDWHFAGGLLVFAALNEVCEGSPGNS